MARIAAVLVVLLVSGCTSSGTWQGTRNVSMWDRNASAGAMGPLTTPSVSD